MNQFDSQSTDRPDDRPTQDTNSATPHRRWAAAAVAGMPLAAGAAPTGQPVGGNPTTVNSPGAGEVLGGIGHLVWNIAGALPGGHLGAAGLAVAAAGLGYAKIRLDKPMDKNTKEGFATRSEIREHFSAEQLLNRVGTLRPALLDRPRRDLLPTDLGKLLGKDVLYKKEVYCSIEDMTLVLAPPRAGKSGLLGGHVIDAPGAAAVTSTRGDLYRHTVVSREKHGPVEVFNADVAGVENTLIWDVPRGCRDAETAVRRAGFLLSGQSVGQVQDASFWEEQSYRVLRSLLMAADIGGHDLMYVREWVTKMSPDTLEPVELLQSYKDVPRGWVSDLRQVITAPERTRDSILLTLISSLECLAIPSVARIVTPVPGGRVFDPEMFLRAGGTLYLMGRDRAKGSIAPLFTALVGELYSVAKQLAAAAPNDRIEPPFDMILDEAAVICPLPLQSWGADAGGSNVHLTISVQSRSQLYDRWGQRGGETIWQLANKLVFGGISVPQDLRDLSELCGEREKEVVTTSTNAKGETTKSTSTIDVPVMTPAKIRRLKKFTGLYIHREAPPVVVKITPVWKRPDVKALAKESAKAERNRAKLEKQAAKLGIDLPINTTPPMPAYKPVIPQQPAQQPQQQPVDPFRKAV